MMSYTENFFFSEIEFFGKLCLKSLPNVLPETMNKNSLIDSIVSLPWLRTCMYLMALARSPQHISSSSPVGIHRQPPTHALCMPKPEAFETFSFFGWTGFDP